MKILFGENYIYVMAAEATIIDQGIEKIDHSISQDRYSYAIVTTCSNHNDLQPQRFTSLFCYMSHVGGL